MNWTQDCAAIPVVATLLESNRGRGNQTIFSPLNDPIFRTWGQNKITVTELTSKELLSLFICCGCYIFETEETSRQ